MKLSHVKDIVLVLATVAAVWYVRKMWKEAQAALENSFAAPIADAIVGATLPDDVEVLGTVVMPGGAQISMGQLYVMSDMTFEYNKRRYKITGRNGTKYTAVVA